MRCVTSLGAQSKVVGDGDLLRIGLPEIRPPPGVRYSSGESLSLAAGAEFQKGGVIEIGSLSGIGPRIAAL